MKIWYAKVSTLDQNPQVQIDALKEAWCEKIFAEHKSGISKDRPKLEEALEFLRKGDTLVVWKLSRLARSLSQVINLANKLASREIHLSILAQKIDTSSAEWRLFFHLMASFDEFQRELIVENTKAWLASARRQGRIGGRRKVDPEIIKMAETMLKDTVNYKCVNDVIKALKGKIWRTSFYTYIPKERIKELRWEVY